ncbi:hypothetical protein AM593_06847, partial [Mytilus galloprovincialis]
LINRKKTITQRHRKGFTIKLETDVTNSTRIMRNLIHLRI